MTISAGLEVSAEFARSSSQGNENSAAVTTSFSFSTSGDVEPIGAAKVRLAGAMSDEFMVPSINIRVRLLHAINDHKQISA